MGGDVEVRRSSFSFHQLVRFLMVFSSVVAAFALAVLLAAVTVHAWRPELVPVPLLAPLMYLLAIASGVAALFGVVHVWLRYPQHMWVLLAVLAIVILTFGAHIYTINSPSKANCFSTDRNVEGCIMDEVYYVPAAQTLLAGTQCQPYFDNCNLEHPFLSKAFIAAGIAIFGDNTFGWRFFQVLLGTMSIPVLFGICWIVTRKRAFSLLATVFFAVDTLFFVHSSIAVIDVHAIFFVLLAFLLYFSKVRLWRFNRYMLAGVALGLSGLSKETSIFFVLFLVTYELLRGEEESGKRRVIAVLEMLAFVGIVFVLGIQLYDSIFATSQNVLTHLKFIFSYGASLKGNGWIDAVLHTPITPINWFLYYSPIGYLITNVTVTGGGTTTTYVGVGYYGVTDKIETWLTFLWAPYVIYLLYKRWKLRRKMPPTSGAPAAAAAASSSPPPLPLPASSVPDVVGAAAAPVPPEGENVMAPGTSSPPTPAPASPITNPEGNGEYELAVFSLLLLAWTFLPYLALYLYGRVTYPYYMIQSVPAVATGAAYFVTREWFPRVMVYVLIAAVIGWFFLFYPDKDFLPVWVRALLGR